MYTEEEDLISLGKLFHRYTILLKYEFHLTELSLQISRRNDPRFELDIYTDEECLLNYHFQKVDVLHLVTALRLPNQFFMQKWYNCWLFGWIMCTSSLFGLPKSFNRPDCHVW
jgi:hypothetical protein